MFFYLLDDIKKRFGRQLYSLLAVAALSVGTLVLGGVLIFWNNIIDIKDYSFSFSRFNYFTSIFFFSRFI